MECRGSDLCRWSTPGEAKKIIVMHNTLLHFLSLALSAWCLVESRLKSMSIILIRIGGYIPLNIVLNEDQ